MSFGSNHPQIIYPPQWICTRHGQCVGRRLGNGFPVKFHADEPSVRERFELLETDTQTLAAAAHGGDEDRMQGR